MISGYPDGTFKPKGELKRAEAAVLLYRVIYDKASSNNGKKVIFD